jgi:hypothetical protein
MDLVTSLTLAQLFVCISPYGTGGVSESALEAAGSASQAIPNFFCICSSVTPLVSG